MFMKNMLLVVYILASPFFLIQSAAAAPVAHVFIEGPIGPGVSSYVVRNIKAAQNREVAAILLTLNTPGGLDTAMRDIVQAILESDKPVACFVSPSGARAASAGTYILMACHVAAMAPGTTIGAATPVAIGGGAPGGAEEGEGDKKKPGMSDKILQDSAAYMRGLARLRGRPVDWAEKFVLEAASVSDEEALEHNIIEFRTTTNRTLLLDIDGYEVKIDGESRTLNTRAAEIFTMEPTWRDNFLAAISDPNIAYILLLVGIYGLIFEFSNPGFMLPGIVGAASLIIAFYALQVLPVNYAGLALLLLGLALIAAEAFAPSFGVLGLGGVAAFVIGSIMLFDTDVPGFQVSRDLIGGIAAVSAILAFLFINFAIRAWRTPVVSGDEAMRGAAATVVDWQNHKGHVHTHGENWAAVSDDTLEKGARVRVKDRQGLKLTVEKDTENGEET